jgi:hypothetical protein
MSKENIVLWFTLGLIVTSVIVMMFVIVQRSNERSTMAAEHGCIYLGTARDLIGVTFYNCNDEIVMKPTGKSL